MQVIAAAKLISRSRKFATLRNRNNNSLRRREFANKFKFAKSRARPLTNILFSEPHPPSPPRRPSKGLCKLLKYDPKRERYPLLIYARRNSQQQIARELFHRDHLLMLLLLYRAYGVDVRPANASCFRFEFGFSNFI